MSLRRPKPPIEGDSAPEEEEDCRVIIKGRHFVNKLLLILIR
jgi:hypothetical protein